MHINQAQPLFMPHKPIREGVRESSSGNFIWGARSCQAALSLSLISWWSYYRPTLLPSPTIILTPHWRQRHQVIWFPHKSLHIERGLSLFLSHSFHYGKWVMVFVSVCVQCCAFYWFIWVLWCNLSHNNQRAKEKNYPELWILINKKRKIMQKEE